MFPIRVALVSKSRLIDFQTLSQTANAINLQVTRDFGPIWGVNATVVALPDPDRIPPGIWPVFMVDDVGEDGALGFHLNQHNQPYALAQFGPTWSLTASHEVLEMLADPSGNRLISSTSVQIADNEVVDGTEKFEYLVEVCDPCEDASTAYVIDDVVVSDFYTPHYFDTVAAPGTRYSFSGKITRPRQLLRNGYLSWINPVTQTLQQARTFGAPDIIDRGQVTLAAPGAAGSSLRGSVDRITIAPVKLSALPAGANIVSKARSREEFLSEAGRSRAANYIPPIPLEALVAAVPAVPAKPELTDEVKQRLSTPGVLSMRVGHRFVDGWITPDPAYVVKARPAALAEVSQILPPQVDGIPVEVRAATPMEVEAADSPTRFAVMAEARHELRLPDFDDHTRLDDAAQPVENLNPGLLLAAARHAKPEIDYSPAALRLDPITDDFTLILHASPEQGWEQLEKFLKTAGSLLVVGMYDFTSGHILETVQSALKDGSVTLTLDHPAPNPSADQSDEDTVARLGGSLHHFESAWALTKSDPKASGWIYPNAYHIKVAVRDDGTFWLSSGNWNNSNQPIIDLSDEDEARKIAKGHDRDWHVVATNSRLADVFRAYLVNDYETARLNQADATAIAAFAAGLPTTADIQVPAAVLAPGRGFKRFFPAKTVTGHFEIQPLLTPDNYLDHVLPLINSATTRFYMQTQYIHPGTGPNDARHNELIGAVQQLVKNGVDVRLICSEYMTADWLEKLADAGLDTSVLRLQPKVHNKGIVVDSQVVMVSSQNWSADGTLRNRDAGLIIRNAEAAKYFEEIFLHDWDYLAAQRVFS